MLDLFCKEQVLCEKFRNLWVVSLLPIRINSDSIYRFLKIFLNIPQWNSRWGTQPEYIKWLKSFLPDGGKGDAIQSQVHSIHHCIRKLSSKWYSVQPVEKLCSNGHFWASWLLFFYWAKIHFLDSKPSPSIYSISFHICKH